MLIFNKFVLVFDKISRKRAYYKVFGLCPKKRNYFMTKDQAIKVFFLVFNSMFSRTRPKSELHKIVVT